MAGRLWPSLNTGRFLYLDMKKLQQCHEDSHPDFDQTALPCSLSA